MTIDPDELSLFVVDAAQLQARLEELSTRVDELAASNKKLAADRDAYHELYLKTLEQCRKLELGLRG